MKGILLVCAVSFFLLSCGGGKHEPEIVDPRLIKVDSVDSQEIIRNGGKWIDTASLQKRNP